MTDLDTAVVAFDGMSKTHRLKQTTTLLACLLALVTWSLWLRLTHNHVVYYMCIQYGTVRAAK